MEAVKDSMEYPAPYEGCSTEFEREAFGQSSLVFCRGRAVRFLHRAGAGHIQRINFALTAQAKKQRLGGAVNNSGVGASKAGGGGAQAGLMPSDSGGTEVEGARARRARHTLRFPLFALARLTLLPPATPHRYLLVVCHIQAVPQRPLLGPEAAAIHHLRQGAEGLHRRGGEDRPHGPHAREPAAQLRQRQGQQHLVSTCTMYCAMLRRCQLIMCLIMCL